MDYLIGSCNDRNEKIGMGELDLMRDYASVFRPCCNLSRIPPNSTDSNIPLSLGIPANTIGTVSGGLAHTRQEWVDLRSLPTGLKIAVALMAQSCLDA